MIRLTQLIASANSNIFFQGCSYTLVTRHTNSKVRKAEKVFLLFTALDFESNIVS